MPCWIRYYRLIKERKGQLNPILGLPSDVVEEVDERLERFFKAKRHEEVEERIRAIIEEGDPEELERLEQMLDWLLDQALRKRRKKEEIAGVA